MDSKSQREKSKSISLIGLTVESETDGRYVTYPSKCFHYMPRSPTNSPMKNNDELEQDKLEPSNEKQKQD